MTGLRAVLRRADDTARRAGATVSARIGDGLHVDGEPVLLEQAGLNLLLNAIDATLAVPPERRSVEVVAERADDRVRLSVSDSGLGFSPEALHGARKPFFTTKGPGNLGLGLALVDKVARAHGGTLSFHNGERGACVVMSVPSGRRAR